MNRWPSELILKLVYKVNWTTYTINPVKSLSQKKKKKKTVKTDSFFLATHITWTGYYDPFQSCNFEEIYSLSCYILNLEGNENKKFYNEVNAWLFSKDRISSFDHGFKPKPDHTVQLGKPQTSHFCGSFSLKNRSTKKARTRTNCDKTSQFSQFS